MKQTSAVPGSGSALCLPGHSYGVSVFRGTLVAWHRYLDIAVHIRRDFKGNKNISVLYKLSFSYLQIIVILLLLFLLLYIVISYLEI